MDCPIPPLISRRVGVITAGLLCILGGYWRVPGPVDAALRCVHWHVQPLICSSRGVLYGWRSTARTVWSPCVLSNVVTYYLQVYLIILNLVPEYPKRSDNTAIEEIKVMDTAFVECSTASRAVETPQLIH